jgi:hypothetical protein
MPARYVIGYDGTILCAYVNPDHARRPEPEKLISAREKATAVAA